MSFFFSHHLCSISIVNQGDTCFLTFKTYLTIYIVIHCASMLSTVDEEKYIIIFTTTNHFYERNLKKKQHQNQVQSHFSPDLFLFFFFLKRFISANRKKYRHVERKTKTKKKIPMKQYEGNELFFLFWRLFKRIAFHLAFHWF